MKPYHLCKGDSATYERFTGRLDLDNGLDTTKNTIDKYAGLDCGLQDRAVVTLPTDFPPIVEDADNSVQVGQVRFAQPSVHE